MLRRPSRLAAALAVALCVTIGGGAAAPDAPPVVAELAAVQRPKKELTHRFLQQASDLGIWSGTIACSDTSKGISVIYKARRGTGCMLSLPATSQAVLPAQHRRATCSPLPRLPWEPCRMPLAWRATSWACPCGRSSACPLAAPQRCHGPAGRATMQPPRSPCGLPPPTLQDHPPR